VFSMVSDISVETSSFSKPAGRPSLSDVFVAGQFDTQKLRWLQARVFRTH